MSFPEEFRQVVIPIVTVLRLYNRCCVEEQDFAESKAAASSYTGGYQQQGGYANAPEPQAAPAPTSRPSPSEASERWIMTIPEGIEEELPFI